MNTRLLSRLAVFALVVLVLVSVLTAAAAANTVPTTRLTDQSRAITANDLKPGDCTMTLVGTPIVCSGGDCFGTDNNDLILGSALADTIKGNKGDDCILGGGGDDKLYGDQGTDVCIGGPGNDEFPPPGNPSCETRFP